MMHDLDEVKKMFVDADNLIKERPELFNMDIDEIFDELDDGSKEMRHIRWGVMTRAKMAEMKSFCSNDILNFMVSIKDRNLLCDYIGYVLQAEHNVSLLELLLNSYEKNVQEQILPFVVSCLEYEEDCHIDRIDTFLEIIESVNENERIRTIYGYSSLILKTNNEDVIFQKYANSYSKILEYLVERIICGLFPEKESIAYKWLDRFVNEDKMYCKKTGIYLVSRSLMYNPAVFEKYYDLLETLCDERACWEQIIGVYLQYLQNENNVLHRKSIKERLKNIKNGSIKEKRICVREIEFKIKCANEYFEIIENLLESSFDKDTQILTTIDWFFDAFIDKSMIKALEMLYKTYEINGYRNGDEFLEHLSQTSVKLKDNQEEVFEIWWNKIIKGSNSDFFLSVEMFRRLFSIEKIEDFLCGIDASKENVLCLLDGIILFTIEEKKIAKLAFAIATCVKDNELLSAFCMDNIFINYSGALVEEAKQHIDSDNEYKKSLAKSIIEYYEAIYEKTKKGYENKNFVPPTERRISYQKMMVEQNRKVLEKANEQSFFARYFSSRTMKYGKRIAFLQTYKKGQYNFNVSEYATNTYSMELPKSFINNPMKYVYARMNYLRRRGKNATNS